MVVSPINFSEPMFEPTGNERTLLYTSFARLIPVSDVASSAFYSKLFEVAPDLRSLFPTDMEAQKEKFMMTLASMIEALDRHEEYRQNAAALGSRHEGYGAKSAHYQVAGDVLLGVLKDVGSFSDEEISVWTKLYLDIAGRMQGQL